MNLLALWIPLSFIVASCSSTQSPIPAGAKAADRGRIGAGEGPAWKDGSLYFTDGRHINRMGPDGKTRVFRNAARAGAANGLMFDREGRLIACESKNRRVTRTEKDGSITVLASHYHGRRFNSPNDLTMDSKGRIYFTDPRYGSREGMEIFERGHPMTGEVIDSAESVFVRPRKKSELPPGITILYPGELTKGLRSSPLGKSLSFKGRSNAIDDLLFGSFGAVFRAVEGVYRIDAPGKVVRVEMPGVDRPNGILVSPNDAFLYVCDNNNNTHGGGRRLIRFDLRPDGTVVAASRKVIFDWKGSRGPDGMKMDRAGRIYVAAGVNHSNQFETDEFKAGCYVLSPSGRLIDFVPTSPDEATNCAFGGEDKKTLFITSGNHLWSVPVKTAGW
jgi:gluconolactonase